MKLDLTGKRAIITAGGAGIGRKTAEVFAAAGARIVICDLDSEALEAARAAIPGLAGAVCDVADATALDAFLDDAIGRLGWRSVTGQDEQSPSRARVDCGRPRSSPATLAGPLQDRWRQSTLGSAPTRLPLRARENPRHAL